MKIEVYEELNRTTEIGAERINKYIKECKINDFNF